MSYQSVEKEIESYAGRLAPDERTKFQNELGREVESLSVREIRDELISEFDSDESHLELVSAAASAFDQDPAAGGYDSGYQFAFTEPLEEQNRVGDDGVKNGDLLLVKEDGADVYLCIIECKSGTADGSSWSSELVEIERIIEQEQYQDILKSQLGLIERRIRHVQYVVLGRISQIMGLKEESLEVEGEIPPNHAYWGYDKGDLEIFQVHGNIQVKSLSRVLQSSVDARLVENPIQFIFGDPPLIHLKVMTEELIDIKQRDNDDEFPFEFNRSDFSELFDDMLQVGFEGVMRESLLNSKVDTLIDIGLFIGLFTDSPHQINSRRDYRILFQGKKPQIAKQTAEEKYFDTMAEEKRKKRAFESVQEEFTPSQTRWEDWDGDE